LSASNLVIVESPAKAKTINKYLGPDYHVIASYGHVRDLVSKDGSVVPEDDFAMKWELGERSGKTMAEIKKAAKNANKVWLATDPDREGEAISWHVREVLDEDNLLENTELHRVAFNEITKKAVQQAFKNARDLDERLIEAYLARRALDYLFGFTLSPVLWRKLPGAKSAGRVQSVSLRLICERETEIEKFVSEEYWTIEARLNSPSDEPFLAKLTHLSGDKLEKLDIKNEAEANSVADRILGKELSVHKVERKQVQRNPVPPFITSTLQMEASRKLRFSASQTMRLAQLLYEGSEYKGETVGLITYMRTDGTTLSEEAVQQCRSLVKEKYGGNYLPQKPRLYKSKAKNAQEAHEAIRPTDISRTPEEIAKFVDNDQAKLYELIWKRTVASQMESALLDKVTADISDGKDDVILRAKGSTIAFDGFLKIYQEGRDEDDNDEENRDLPPLKEGDKTRLIEVLPEQHFTQPPPRFTEASLVKKLEDLGIGRPSTYAAILQVLRDRKYVTLEKRRFIPEDRGRLVTSFLTKFFPRYVDYSFTADLEDELDAIATGHVYWKEALKLFWNNFKSAVDETKDLTVSQVIEYLDGELGENFFRERSDGKDPRKCPSCEDGRLSLKLGKYGAFIGCSNYPDCRYTRPLIVQDEDESGENKNPRQNNEPRILGEDPGSGRNVSLRNGPYGPYVQLDPPPESKEKPKRQGLPRGMDMEEVSLDKAIQLLSLPREVGKHPETGDKIEAGIGRFGPYIKYQGKFRSIPKDDDVLYIGLNRAVDILAQPAPQKKKANKKQSATAAKGKKKTAKTGTKAQ
jgi:DNA topoisomerase-1